MIRPSLYNRFTTMRNIAIVLSFCAVLLGCSSAPKASFEGWYNEAINEPYTADVAEYDPATGALIGSPTD